MPFLSACRAAVSAAVSLLAVAAFAGADDHRFELAVADLRVGSGQAVDLVLTDLRTGARVVDAVIFATRMDMAPDGMEMMTLPVTVAVTDEPGLYRLVTDLTMPGTWRLSVAAKLQGEIETVTSRIEFEVQP